MAQAVACKECKDTNEIGTLVSHGGRNLRLLSIKDLVIGLGDYLTGLGTECVASAEAETDAYLLMNWEEVFRVLKGLREGAMLAGLSLVSVGGKRVLVITDEKGDANGCALISLRFDKKSSRPLVFFTGTARETLFSRQLAALPRAVAEDHGTDRMIEQRDGVLVNIYLPILGGSETRQSRPAVSRAVARR